MTSAAIKRLPLGKTPARPDAVKLKLKTYLSKTQLPTPPRKFGHYDLVRAPWGVLGNDSYGDCVWAGAAHETMLWCMEAGVTTTFSTESVLSDYTAVTGFNPNDINSDQGTDMQAAASYRRKTGVLDASGKRHQIDAYLAIEPGDINTLKLAIYLFGAVGIGILFPDSAMKQFNQGKRWSVVSHDPKPNQGHYIPGVGFDGNDFVTLTWGKAQRMTPAFFKKYCDEALAYISLERLTDSRSLDGFHIDALRADLAAITSARSTGA